MVSGESVLYSSSPGSLGPVVCSYQTRMSDGFTFPSSFRTIADTSLVRILTSRQPPAPGYGVRSRRRRCFQRPCSRYSNHRITNCNVRYNVYVSEVGTHIRRTGSITPSSTTSYVICCSGQTMWRQSRGEGAQGPSLGW